MSQIFQRVVQSLAAVAVLLVSQSGLAEAVPAEIAEQVLLRLKEARPELPYGEVQLSPIAGVYKVQISQGPSIYVSADGRHFIDGDMYRVTPGQFVNIQEREREAQRSQLMASVSLADQIIFAAEGETKAYIQVFTDVDCGYCRKLHQEVPELNAMGIEVRYLAFPRAGLKSASYDKIATAWCADNPQEVLTTLKTRKSVAIDACEDNPVAAQLALGQRIGVRGTPSIIFADGRMIPGYVPAKDLAKALGL